MRLSPGVHRVASDGATPQIAEAAAARDWSVVDELVAAGSAGLPQAGPALLSLRDGAWSAHAWHDLEPDRQRLPWQWDARDALAVDADGALWFGSAGGSGRPEVMIGSHDGEELRWNPEVVDARELEIGPDGNPWIAAADGLYVIDLAEAPTHVRTRCERGSEEVRRT